MWSSLATINTQFSWIAVLV